VDRDGPMLYHDLYVRLMPDSDDGGTSSRGAGLTSQQIKEILDQHNGHRANEGASDMEIMVRQWLDCSLRLAAAQT